VKAGWTVRHRTEPGDIGFLIHLHGVLYAKECGYDRTFEAYVAAGLAEFVRSFRRDRDRIWLAEADGRIIGSIAIAARTNASAQLRWFLVHPDHRGRGIGTGLLRRALRFCRERGYRTVFLWTTSELQEAARLYARFGFHVARRKTHRIWGGEVREERYDLRL
jgi:GNAT superfamily N-acetyltransferase